MATGANWAAPGAVSGLWHINFKVNADNRGFNFKLHVAQVVESVALAAAIDIALRLRYIMPADTEIFYATISKDDSKKDSRFVRGAIGPGLYVNTGTGPPPSVVDFSRTSLLVRFETDDGGWVTRKFPCLPDLQVTANELVNAIADTTGLPGVLPAAPTDGTAWAANYLGLIKAIMVQTHHVKSGHTPGGEYTYFPWKNAYPLRIGDKKGGRVFI